MTGQDPWISQTGGDRCVVEGRRIGNADGTCTVVAIRVKGYIDIYPHGSPQLGVRLANDEARKLGEFIQGRLP